MVLLTLSSSMIPACPPPVQVKRPSVQV